MKEIKSIVSGVAVTGKVGDYIFYNRLGVPCVRRANLRKKNPGTCTPGQRISQDRMRYLVSLYKALKGTSVGQAWRLARKRPGQTGFNAFVSRNYAAFGKDEVIADWPRRRPPAPRPSRWSGPPMTTKSWGGPTTGCTYCSWRATARSGSPCGTRCRSVGETDGPSCASSRTRGCRSICIAFGHRRTAAGFRPRGTHA